MKNSFFTSDKVEVQLMFIPCDVGDCATNEERENFMSKHHFLLQSTQNYIDIGEVKSEGEME